jgi:transposase, IS5 family
MKSDIISKRKIRHDTGRNGMNYRQILVISVLRLNNNWDYDHLENMVNPHREIRLMLGLPDWDHQTKFKRKTLINNFKLVSAKSLLKISNLVIHSGHKYLGVEEKFKSRDDSFELESNVSHTTDSNL